MDCLSSEYQGNLTMVSGLKEFSRHSSMAFEIDYFNFVI